MMSLIDLVIVVKWAMMRKNYWTMLCGPMWTLDRIFSFVGIPAEYFKGFISTHLQCVW